jgi:selenocysteine lyase/cysteine desulfurase
MLGGGEAPGFPRLDGAGSVVYPRAGRAALWLALEACGLRPGETVLLPTYHCPTMVEPAAKLGARLVFYPLHADGRPDLDAIAPADLAGARALLVAHLFGVPLDLGPARALCDRHGITLIEDAAHAWFGHRGGVPVGATGDWAIGSAPKFFAVPLGGCLVRRAGPVPALHRPGWRRQAQVAWDLIETGGLAARRRSRSRADTLLALLAGLKRRLRGQSAAPEAAFLDEPDLARACDTIDPARVHEALPGAARAVLRHSDAAALCRRRRENHDAWVRALSGTPDLTPLHPVLPPGAVPYVCAVRLDGPPDEAYQRIRHAGIPVYRWDLVWPGTPRLPGDAAPGWWRHLIQLSCHQDLTDEDIAAMALTLRDALRSPA